MSHVVVVGGRGSTCINLNTGTTCRYMYVTCGGSGGGGECMYTFKYWNYLQIHVCHMWWEGGSACIHLNTGTTCRYMYATCGGGGGGECMYTFKYWNYLQIHVCHMWGGGSACIHLNTGTTCTYMCVTCVVGECMYTFNLFFSVFPFFHSCMHTVTRLMHSQSEINPVYFLINIFPTLL